MGEMITQNLYDTRELPPYLKVSAASVTGTRPYQEDCLMYQVLEDGVLGVVCDGMGGLAHGERSSACAVDALAWYFAGEPRNIFDMRAYWERALCSLDDKVAALRQPDGSLLEGGTTMTAVFIQENKLSYAAAGDSMIYLIRRGEISRLVRMHNYQMLLDEQLQNGEITPEGYAREQKQGEALVSYLGMGGIKIWDCAGKPFLLEDGDRILLCSDGLYKGLSEEEILQTASAFLPEQFEKTALELVRQIFTGPPRNLDNISILCFLYHLRHGE